MNNIYLNETNPVLMNIYFKYCPLYYSYDNWLSTGSKIIFS